MEKLLTTYLYQNKNCPLPGVGSLLMHPGHAEFLPGQKKMLAPIPYLELSNSEVSSDGLIDFIAAQKQINTAEADTLLSNYCNRIKSLPSTEEFSLPALGSFYKDENEDLQFKPTSLPASFFREVAAERVIHPDVAHSILVGDTQTNSAAMTELLNTGEEQKRSRWWIAAVIMGSIAAISLIIYFTNHNPSGLFGSIKTAEATQSSKSYQSTGK